MTKTIDAIFENGIFRPVQPVELSEGERVQITITEGNGANAKSPGERPYEMVKEIAALPDEGPDDDFSGADHDMILYGGKDGVR